MIGQAGQKEHTLTRILLAPRRLADHPKLGLEPRTRVRVRQDQRSVPDRQRRPPTRYEILVAPCDQHDQQIGRQVQDDEKLANCRGTREWSIP